jgi:hypothetical protein
MAESSYRAALGDPPECAPGDIEGAKRYLARLDRMLERDGWTRSERVQLYRLRSKWRKRAEGKDPRFNAVGTKPGRLSAEQEIALRQEAAQLAIANTLAKARRAQLRDIGSADGPEGHAKGGRDLEDLENPVNDDDISDPEDHAHGTDHSFFVEGRRFQFIRRPEKVSVTKDDYFFVAASDQKGGKARLQCTIQPQYSRAIEELVKSGLYGSIKTHGDFFRWAVARAIEHLQNLKPHPKIRTFLHQAWLIDEMMANERAQQAVGDAVEQLDKQLQAFRGMPGGTAKARNLAQAVKDHIDSMPDGFWRNAYLSKWTEVEAHLFDSRRLEGVQLDQFEKD